MTIMYVDTGKVVEVPDAYGARLNEQGMATPVTPVTRPKRKGEKHAAVTENP